jgi:FMN phosphatase YigB (HAD superfamily)
MGYRFLADGTYQATIKAVVFDAYGTLFDIQSVAVTMCKALRMQMDELGLAPDYRAHGLAALVETLSLRNTSRTRAQS